MVRILLFTGLLFGGLNLQAQVRPDQDYSEVELSQMRAKYLQQLNKQAPQPIGRVQSNSAFAQLNAENAAQNSFKLQLKTVLPNYVPFTIAPPNSALAGIGVDNPWNGSIPYRYNGNILIYPNDPTNGWARVTMGTLGNMLGYMVPGIQANPLWYGYNSFTSPFGYYNTPFYFAR